MGYRSANAHYREKFGCKVYKLSIDGGFSCPNRDGTVGTGGCVFCSGDGGGEFAQRGNDIPTQLEQAKGRVEAKNPGGKYIAYFQAFTNTYAPVAVLEEKFRQAIAPAEIVGLAIATRPDCVPDEVVALLAQLNRIKPVSVELGFQTANERTAAWMNRGYVNRVYLDAVRRLKKAGLEVVTHIIIGLPGEGEQDALNTTRMAVAAGTDGVKFHLLHVLEGTRLAEYYKNGQISCLSLEEYGSILRACIASLPPQTVVHRITGDGARKNLIAPLWSADKKRVLNYLRRILEDSGNSFG